MLDLQLEGALTGVQHARLVEMPINSDPLNTTIKLEIDAVRGVIVHKKIHTVSRRSCESTLHPPSTLSRTSSHTIQRRKAVVRRGESDANSQ